MRKPEVEVAQIKWLDAVDALLGDGNVESDIAEGLRLARECEHDDAKWLVSLFPDGPPPTKEEAKRVFLAQANDPRAMFFGAYTCWMGDRDENLVRRAAYLGYAPAQAEVALWSEGHESVAWAEKSAGQGDRDGLYQLGECLWNGEGCDKDANKALLLYKEAAQRGHLWAQLRYGTHAFQKNDWERYVWWGRAANQGCPGAQSGLVDVAAELMKLRDWNGRWRRVLFEVGAACKGHVDVFSRYRNDRAVLAIERAVALHEEWCADAERAICCWVWIARKKKIVKDIRTAIAKMLWADKAFWSETTIRRSRRKWGRKEK
jgi:hypothetical protein